MTKCLKVALKYPHLLELPIKYSNISSPDERRLVRETYIKLQEGKCMYCGGNLYDKPPSRIANKPVKESLFPQGFFKWPIHIQHCHKTGMTEGVVHAKCNAILWQYHGR
jgi:hypothetical protein